VSISRSSEFRKKWREPREVHGAHQWWFCTHLHRSNTARDRVLVCGTAHIYSVEWAVIRRDLLGQVLKDLTGSRIRSMESTTLEDEPELPLASNSMRLSHATHISAEDHEALREASAELLALRNDLVHHFIKKFIARDDPDYAVAKLHLLKSSDLIEERFRWLYDFANSVHQANKALICSDAFKDWTRYGAEPDCTVDWPSTLIVRQLQAAESECSTEGWTLLTTAIDHIRKTRADVIPEIYGRKSWAQVIHESRLFQTEKRPTSNGRQA
jgi:hypothetical protein